MHRFAAARAASHPGHAVPPNAVGTPIHLSNSVGTAALSAAAKHSSVVREAGLCRALDDPRPAHSVHPLPRLRGRAREGACNKIRVCAPVCPLSTPPP